MPVNERYSRQILLKNLQESGQKKLAKSHVVVIGCGALGTTIANNLVRAGIGNITIVDRDIVELNNLQRQNLFDEDNIGLPKASIAVKKLRKINSDIKNLDKKMIQTAVIKFAEQFSSILSECSVAVYIRAHREKQKQKKLIFTRIQIIGHKHKYDASAEAWGVTLSLKEALEKLERQVLKEKPSKKHRRNRS